MPGLKGTSAMAASAAATGPSTAPAGKQAAGTASMRPGRVEGPVSRPDDHVIVLFGATGDPAQRKLLPDLFHLAAAGLMPDRYQIIGSFRRFLTERQTKRSPTSARTRRHCDG
jgi:hypothetical protein